ncbi:MAG: tetratricopeptide repeat protein [Planctomycetes bacterium]|nr:tetratricopeptide repeat protein [Planctomycetota bacterium]
MPDRVTLDSRSPRCTSRCDYVWMIALLLLCAANAREVAADDARPALKTPRPLATSRESAAAQSLATANHTGAANDRVKQLIRQLGDPRYTARRTAANEIREIGAEAFDLLHEATGDSDPEVAASARYLLRQISVRWVESDDSPAVRSLLRDYDRQPDTVRLRRVDSLAELADGDGIAGLCRIARFDRSPIVSRMAALAIIRPEEQPAAPSQVDSEVVERELGSSSRAASAWLRRYLVQLRDPAASVEFWQTLIDDEVARLEQNAADTSPEIVSGLLWNLAEVYRQLGNRAATTGVVNRMMDVHPDAIDSTAVELLTWLYEHESWEVLDDFLAKHQDQLEQSKRPLYYAALARAKQGKADMAEQLAEKAAQIDPQNTLESFLTAKDLEEHSRFKWAVREYRRSINDQNVASHEGILARIYLGSLLHDYEQHQEAADVLEPLAKSVKNEGKVGQLYAELQRYYERRLNLPKAEAVLARFHYYRACQYHQEKHWSRERSELEDAIKLDPTDADVLIAMYRLPESDDAWREAVRKRIRDLCRQFQQEIDENPSDPNAYNQWAWLVSNTEGDYQKAIRYSHRSVELIPSSAGDSAGASFLDTLGRCYFAAGDLENALKYQRQAIEKVDYMQVMHRQLAQFEKAMAEKNSEQSN